MMTMPSMLKTNKELWHKFHEIFDIVLTHGIYDAPDFGRWHREYLFAYISRKNNCYYCSTMHFALAKEFGVTSLPKEITDLADSLYESILMPHLGEFTPLVEQILYTISIAKFINTQVVAHDVHVSPTTLLQSPVFRESGYGIAFGALKDQQSYK